MAMTDDEAVKVRGSWPLAILRDGAPLWHVAGSNPPQYAADPALEALWKQRRTTMRPTTIELFAGIAGFSSRHTHALAFVEKEATCRAILRRHYPHAAILDDVRTAGAHNLPWANIIKFGFPCQDLSVAGNRAGLVGARSGLFYEATRIVNELRPDYAVWENVPGLLSSGNGRDFLSVLTELERIGYVGGWSSFDAQYFGVAQRRQRIFGVFARRDIGAERVAEILSFAARLPWNTPTGRQARAHVAGTIAAGTSSGVGVNAPGRRREDDYNLVGYGGNNTSGSIDVAAALNAHGGAGRMDFESETFIAAPAISQSNRGRDSGDTFETLRAGSHGSLPMVASALSASHGGADDNDAQAGHIVAFQQNQRNEIRDLGGIAGALPAQPGMKQQNYLQGSFGVRRLTPTECERLQGFDDGWTAHGIDERGERVEMSDSTRYRMLGNAVCRKVSAWLDSQIVRYGYGE